MTEISINVKKLDGNVFVLKITSTTSIPELKEKIQNLSGIDPSLQRLIYKGKVLRDDKDVEFYKIEEGTTLHLAERAPEAPTTPSTGNTTNINSNINNIDPNSGIPRFIVNGGNVPPGDIGQTISNVLRQLAGPGRVVVAPPPGSVSPPHPSMIENQIRNSLNSITNFQLNPSQRMDTGVESQNPADSRPAVQRLVSNLELIREQLQSLIQNTNNLADQLRNESTTTGATERQTLQQQTQQLAQNYSRLASASNHFSQYLQSFVVGAQPGQSHFSVQVSQVVSVQIEQDPNAPSQPGNPTPFRIGVQPQSGSLVTPIGAVPNANQIDPFTNIFQMVFNNVNNNIPTQPSPNNPQQQQPQTQPQPQPQQQGANQTQQPMGGNQLPTGLQNMLQNILGGILSPQQQQPNNPQQQQQPTQLPPGMPNLQSLFSMFTEASSGAAQQQQQQQSTSTDTNNNNSALSSFMNNLPMLMIDFRFLFSGVPSQMVQGHTNIRRIFVSDFLNGDTSEQAIDNYVQEFITSLKPILEQQIIQPDMVSHVKEGSNLIQLTTETVQTYIKRLFKIILTEPNENNPIPVHTTNWTREFIRTLIDQLASGLTGGVEDAFTVINRFVGQQLQSMSPIFAPFSTSITQYIRNTYNASLLVNQQNTSSSTTETPSAPQPATTTTTTTTTTSTTSNNNNNNNNYILETPATLPLNGSIPNEWTEIIAIDEARQESQPPHPSLSQLYVNPNKLKKQKVSNSNSSTTLYRNSDDKENKLDDEFKNDKKRFRD